MAFYNHLSSTLSADSAGGVSVRRKSRCPLRVSDSVRRKSRCPLRVSDSVRRKSRCPLRVSDSSDAKDTEKPISEGDIVYAASPKLGSKFQGVPLKVVAVHKRINMVIVQLPDGQSKSVPLSLVKR